jgi:hypothetical protein
MGAAEEGRQLTTDRHPGQRGRPLALKLAPDRPPPRAINIDGDDSDDDSDDDGGGVLALPSPRLGPVMQEALCNRRESVSAKAFSF